MGDTVGREYCDNTHLQSVFEQIKDVLVKNKVRMCWKYDSLIEGIVVWLQDAKGNIHIVCRGDDVVEGARK